MKGFIVKAVLVVTGWGWVRWIFTRTRIGRRVSMRFVAGETLQSAIDAARRANEAGMPVSLNCLGEHVTDEVSARASFEAYRAAIDAIRAEGIDGNISVKPTQLGLGADDDLCEELLGALASSAAAAGTTVTIDMEDSPLVEATIALYERQQREHGNLGLALQAYLHRTPGDLDRLHGLGGHIRLCKGAYDEPASAALHDRAEIDAAFDDLLDALMVDGGPRPAVATHDGDRIDHAITRAGDRTEGWEFQMLFGVRTALQQDLTERGFTVRPYIPYGDAWYPYLTRRMAERPANFWFFLRALFGR